MTAKRTVTQRPRIITRTRAFLRRIAPQLKDADFAVATELIAALSHTDARETRPDPSKRKRKAVKS